MIKMVAKPFFRFFSCDDGRHKTAKAADMFASDFSPKLSVRQNADAKMPGVVCLKVFLVSSVLLMRDGAKVTPSVVKSIMINVVNLVRWHFPCHINKYKPMNKILFAINRYSSISVISNPSGHLANLGTPSSFFNSDKFTSMLIVVKKRFNQFFSYHYHDSLLVSCQLNPLTGINQQVN